MRREETERDVKGNLRRRRRERGGRGRRHASSCLSSPGFKTVRQTSSYSRTISWVLSNLPVTFTLQTVTQLYFVYKLNCIILVAKLELFYVVCTLIAVHKNLVHIRATQPCVSFCGNLRWSVGPKNWWPPIDFPPCLAHRKGDGMGRCYLLGKLHPES